MSTPAEKPLVQSGNVAGRTNVFIELIPGMD